MADVPKGVLGASRDVKDVSRLPSVPAFATVHFCAVQASGLPYVILRSPILTDTNGRSDAISATQAVHPLSGKMKIGRADVAAAMIRAAQFAPFDSTWDLVPAQVGNAPNWWTAERAKGPVPSAAMAM